MIKHMSLISFVRQECANFVSTDCLGITIFGKRFRKQGICFILENKPCVYFARCLLPLAKVKGYGDVIASYQKIDIDSKLIRFKTRKCECGADIPKGKKFCENCRKERRQKTDRENQRKCRVQRHTVY